MLLSGLFDKGALASRRAGPGRILMRRMNDSFHIHSLRTNFRSEHTETRRDYSQATAELLC